MRDKLLSAYLQTDYLVFDEQVIIRLDKKSDGVEELLDRYNAKYFAFISAHNPRSQAARPTLNAERHIHLKNEIRRMGYTAMEGEGRGRKGDWPAEKSFLILDIGREEARALARRLDQYAFLYGTRESAAQLVFV